jgi:hypothetical protein
VSRELRTRLSESFALARRGRSRDRGLSLLVVRDSLDRNHDVRWLSLLVVRDSLDRNHDVRWLSLLVVRV